MQNLRRGHYALGLDARTAHLRLAAAFYEFASALLQSVVKNHALIDGNR